MQKIAAMLVVATTLATSNLGAAEPAMKLSCQAWTFRRYTFVETLDILKKAGIHYVEAFPGQKLGGDLTGSMHFNMPVEVRAQVQAKLKDAGVKLGAFGVVGAKDEAEWRKLFEFAKAMGIETITSEPGEKQLDYVDRLAQEFKIKVAIHNHPKPSHYWNPDTVIAACKGRSQWIGSCSDTGHWVRSGLDPIECLKKLEDRVLHLHFKDLNVRDAKAYDVPWGAGASDAAGQLRELKRQGFHGIVSAEYEHDTPELASNVRKCAEFFRAQTGAGN